MNNLTEAVVTIVVAIIGLATLAVIVGRNARTSEVISSASQGLTSLIGVAVSPVQGGGFSGIGNRGFM